MTTQLINQVSNTPSKAPGITPKITNNPDMDRFIEINDLQAKLKPLELSLAMFSHAMNQLFFGIQPETPEHEMIMQIVMVLIDNKIQEIKEDIDP